MKEKNKYILIDGMALIYKAFYAFKGRQLSNSKGEPTSASYGFLNQLFKIIQDTKPDYLAVALDSKEKTFRHQVYDKYKSTRQPIPEDLIPQIGRIKQILNAFNIPIYLVPGCEADDIIGVISRKNEKSEIQTIAVTSDKDLIQLITDLTKIARPDKTSQEFKILDEAKIQEDYGFPPINFIDYLALTGDSSDDIPGVPNIGPKKALPLIQKYLTIENLYNDIDNISPESLRKNLIDGKDSALLSKQLVTITTEIDFNFSLEEAKIKKPNVNELVKIFQELEFKSFITKLKELYPGQDTIETAVTETTPAQYDIFDQEKIIYKLITKEDDAKKFADKLSKSKLFVFDTETDSLDFQNLNLVGVSFSMQPKQSYFIALAPKIQGSDLFNRDLTDRLDIDIFIKLFKPIFENETIKKVCQNAKFDMAVLRNYKFNVKNLYFDTMLAAYLLDPDQKNSLDNLAKKYLNYTPIEYSDLIASKTKGNDIYDVEINKLSDYSCEDADITFQLFKIFEKELENANLLKLANEVEFPLVYVLEDMERTGIKIDKEILQELSIELEKKIFEISEKIYKASGEQFNINSPQQLQKILFEKLKLNPSKKTKTGFSTDAQALEALKGEHEIIDLILDIRQISKLKTTYTDALPELINEKTKRIHTTFNQQVTATGRLSSLRPNLQNIPIRTDMGKEIRKAFIAADKNHKLLCADYNQIELRIMAHLSGDETLIEAFNKGEDIHTKTAALIFGVGPKDVNSDMRRKAKEVNFGILYGLGPFGLKTRLGIPQAEAQRIIDNYFYTFKQVKSFMLQCIKEAKEKEYSETLLGRRRFLRNINSNNRTIRQFEERVAINMPIQGTAADMIKLAMIKIYDEFNKQKLKSKMVLQVHDELIFDIPNNEVNESSAIIKELMEGAMILTVPISVNIGVADNWLDAH
ncbi:MAG: DNA polymerase I [Ignavibacteriales bacterium]|nr:DNA polymerase I [Ignavibacteriales bacterium]